MKRAVAPCLALAIAFGCREQQSVTSPESPRISADILDGAHGRGNTSFFFLPPMVAQPSFSGVFNPNLGPVVQICTLTVTGGGTVCDPSIAPINPGGVQVDPVGQKYQVNWNKIGRASCRERVEISVVAVTLNKKTTKITLCRLGKSMRFICSMLLSTLP